MTYAAYQQLRDNDIDEMEIDRRVIQNGETAEQILADYIAEGFIEPMTD